MKFYVSGDTHGDFSRFYDLPKEPAGVILLGDCAFNYFLDMRDTVKKEKILKDLPHITFFCVRGNHEARPQDIPSMTKVLAPEIGNYVYMELDYPNILYLLDGEEYNFNQYKALVIGGAYSVDKPIRLKLGYHWFPNEQLQQEEMKAIEEIVSGRSYDLILTHTCPWSWEPRDLFTENIPVDNSMEIWLDQLKDKIQFKTWLCGHFHDDRYLAPRAQLLYFDIKDLNEIMEGR